ncbi:MAG TPA: hypothetical protein QF753_00200 [Victivallales bacterium]|nr:hypothetical protein [Victivallales bacterium]
MKTGMQRLTRTQAIKANCKMCDCESSTRYLKCSDESCSLHKYRLGTYHTGKSKAIRSYCKWCMGCDRGKYKTPLSEIKLCPSESECPLYRYRMGEEEKSYN